MDTFNENDGAINHSINVSTENLPTHNKHDKTDSNKILNWSNLCENKVKSEDFTIEIGKFQSVWDNQSILEDF